MVSSTPRPYFTPGKDPVPIVQEARWAPRPVWTDGKSRPTGIRSPDRPARSSVAIPTELPAHLFITNNCEIMVQWQSAIHSLKLHRTSSLRWGSGANLALAIKIKIPKPSDKILHNLHYWELWIEMIWRLVTNTLYKALS